MKNLYQINQRVYDFFRSATADDKWEEYNTNNSIIERDGTVWHRLKMDNEGAYQVIGGSRFFPKEVEYPVFTGKPKGR